jgi:hypothetical protein
MPSSAELARLDDLVKETAPSSAIQRLSAPDRIEKVGQSKFGYFTYLIKQGQVERRARVDWRIEKGDVQLISVKFEGDR